MDLWFLNYLQSPLFSLLHKTMKIEMYHDMYFQPIKISVHWSIEYEASNQVNLEALKLHQDEPKILPMTELSQKSGNCLPLFEEKYIQLKFILHNNIIQSKDRLFFVEYTPKINLWERQCLVLVDLVNTS